MTTQLETSSDADQIGAAAAVVRSQHEILTPYLPRLVVDWVATSPELRHRSVEGTVAFVDISGFTKLSEQLAKHGKIGAEELTATIGACFVHLLEVAYAGGGNLLKFGGDALLLMFSGPDHERRACRAAHEMRSQLRVIGRMTVLGHRVALRMSVGIHSGRFDLFLVGGSHRELVITGPAASTTVSMEGTATAGEILVSESIASALAPSDLGAAKGPGRLLRRAPAVGGPSLAAHDPIEAHVDLSSCIPTAILSSLVGGSHEPEHRRVTVAFIHYDGTDALLESSGPESLADYLDSLICDVQLAVEPQGVTFIGTDIDHDGGKVILAAGTPSSSGDDEHRMLLALRQIMDRERHPPLRVGVARGPVFSGDIGPPFRRTFTVMGDTVNLAARLMAKAVPGRILASPSVLARSRSEFALTEVEPFFVKGKAKPVEAFEVGARTGAKVVEAGSRLPLVGRDGEMRQWDDMVRAARAGTASMIELIGEPGVGKSRLLEEFRATCEGLRVLSASCEYYDSTTPYKALRGLVRGLLGLEGLEGDQDAGQQLNDTVAGLSPSLVPWVPLIGLLADVEVPDTSETAEIDPEFRALRLGEVTVDLLSVLLAEPAVFFIEDTHWMDEASADLLRHVTANVEGKPWLLCFTRRDVEGGFTATGPSTVRLDLQPLGAEAAAELVHLASQGSPLTEHEVSLLAERSGGNPLFLRELLAAARDEEDIESLPDSVEALIAARIDRLSSDDRHFLRRVSVLGRSAPVDLLTAVLDTVPRKDDSLWSRLSEFVAPDGSGHVVFRHALLRDGAYSGLSYRSRRELHGRTADAIVNAAGGEPESQAELLSLHYLRAQRFDEAWRYSLIAAERAVGLYANIEASEFFERALSAAKRMPELDSQKVAEVQEALGDARTRVDEYVPAVAAYRAARRLETDDPVSQARLMMKLSRVQGWLESFSNALRWITRALSTLDGVEGRDAERQRAQLLSWYGRYCQEAGNHARAIKWCTLAVEQAERSDEKEALVNALGVLDWAQMDLGGLEQPGNWERGLAVAEEIGDIQAQATMLNAIGMFAYFQGRWADAVKFYGEARERARRSGNQVQIASYENNMAEVALDQGRIEEAERLFESGARIWRAAGFRSGDAQVMCYLARCAARAGRYEEAMSLLAESRKEAETLGSRAGALEAGARWAECELLAGHVHVARERAETELEYARALGGGPQLPLLHRVRGAALARQGDLDGARRALEQSFQEASSRQADYELALTLSVMAALGLEHDGRTAQALAEQSRRILEGMGVVSVPDLLGAKSASSSVASPSPA